MSPFLPMIQAHPEATVVSCAPDAVGNDCLMALVEPGFVFLVGTGKGEAYTSLVLTVHDLDRIRTEMAKLEGVN